jgi:hypothetical protein
MATDVRKTKNGRRERERPVNEQNVLPNRFNW